MVVKWKRTHRLNGEHAAVADERRFFPRSLGLDRVSIDPKEQEGRRKRLTALKAAAKRGFHALMLDIFAARKEKIDMRSFF